MTYKEKLRSPLWQKKRLQILERDGWRCVICGDDKSNLQVHHLVYAKADPWDYPEYVYQTLCDVCHEERGELTNKMVDAFRLAIAKVPTERLVKVGEKLIAEAMGEMEVK